MLLSDVRNYLDVLFATKEFINLEVVNGGSIPTDLRELLCNKDCAELQIVIRDNVYQKTVPFTTRPPKEGELDGVHYRFVDASLFEHLKRTNQLLEHGHYQGYLYGTPKPLEEDEMVIDSKGPLPPNWEIAYSEQGEKYFINHNSGTTQWEDPRDLPEGWEKVDDGIYGTFYVDHVNKRTQYERPIGVSTVPGGVAINSHACSSNTLPPCHMNGNSALQDASLISNAHIPSNAHNRRHSTHCNSNTSPSQQPHSSCSMFTRDPSQLRGELITTRIVKGPKGLGFTLIGNDGSSLHEEFLQIKSVIPGGPAHHNGVLRMGDVLVYVNNECVLGTTQSHACRIFQSISIGETVTLQVCRGYPLLLDPANKIITENAYSTRPHDEREIIIRKGDDGFGFTIFESVQGQRVKKILHPERCENLLEGDTLLEMRSTYPQGSPLKPIGPERVTNFRGMPHHDLVSILRDCPVGFWAKLLVRRNSPRHRSRTPTAAFRYGEQRNTPIPNVVPRSKTPAPQPPRPAKNYSNVSSLPPHPSTTHRLENGVPGMHHGARNTIPRQHERRTNEEIYENFSRVRPSSTSLGFATPNYVPMTPFISDGSETITVNLIRKPNGFGFRVVGGTEEGTCISVGQVVPGGAAADDGRLQQGDEIIEIEGKNVCGESHATAVKLMQQAAANGHVKLVVRRKKEMPRSTSMPSNQLNRMLPTYDVVLTRTDHDGFGFVIISSVHKNGSTIGRIMDDSPAARCGQLRVGDRVIAVNGIDIMSLPHNEIVNLIKDSGLSVRLTIAPPSPASPSQAGVHQPPQTGLPYTTASSQSLPYQNGGPQFSGSYNQAYEAPHFRRVDQDGYQESKLSPTPPEAESALISVELNRGPKGFGFSIRGGQEFDAMPLFVLRIADDGPAAADGRLRVGDQLMEINGQSTKGMTHANAIQIIKQYPNVKLFVRRPQPY